MALADLGVGIGMGDMEFYVWPTPGSSAEGASLAFPPTEKAGCMKIRHIV